MTTNLHLKIITKCRQVSLQPQVKLLTMRRNLQMHMLFLANRATRSSVFRVQVLCVVAQCLIMRYVFIQTFSCERNEKEKTQITKLPLPSQRIFCGFRSFTSKFALEQRTKKR